MYTMCKQITMRWLFCNKVLEKWQVQENLWKKVNIHMRDRDVRENEETKKENGSSKDNL